MSRLADCETLYPADGSRVFCLHDWRYGDQLEFLDAHLEVMLQLIGYDDITLIDCAGVDDDLQTRDGLFAEAIGQINVVSDPGRGRS